MDIGYLYFDTAECYTGNREDGSLAYNEDLVGEALKPYRNNVVIASKFGVHHSPQGLVTDSRPETIRKAVEGSLKRLQTDYIDLYYQHRIDPEIPAEGDYRNFMPQYKDEAVDANQALMEYIRLLAAEKQATPAQISLAWMINKRPYIVPIPGSRKAERIRENAGAADIELTAQEVAEIDEKLNHMEMSDVFGGSPTKK